MIDHSMTVSAQSIVTNYAALILEDVSDILKNTDLSAEASRLLWIKVIQTLQKTFTHDQDGRFRD